VNNSQKILYQNPKLPNLAQRKSKLSSPAKRSKETNGMIPESVFREASTIGSVLLLKVHPLGTWLLRKTT
jgi:hypothetical protein